MLITIDLGNTKFKIGLWENDRSVAFAIYDSFQKDYRTVILNFLYKQNIRTDMVNDSIISSVVPASTEALRKALFDITGKEPIIISTDNSYGLKLSDSVKKELGSDLLVMSVYAHDLYKKDVIVISLGTASVLSYIDADGNYSSCTIAPGFEAMAEALYGNAAKLPQFSPKKMDSFVATNTLDAMNVGLFDGYIGMIRYLLSSLVKELGIRPAVIACGGQGRNVVPYIKEISSYEADLVSKALFYIYRRYYSA